MVGEVALIALDEGGRLVWLDTSVVNRPGESYNDVISRLGEAEAQRSDGTTLAQARLSLIAP